MSSGQYIRKQITPIKVEHIQPEFVGLLSKSQKKSSKDRRDHDIQLRGWKNFAVSKHEKITHPNKGHGSGNKQGIAGSKHNQLNEVNLLLAQKTETAEAFVNQKLFVGKYLSKDGANCKSRQFLDALEVLNSNKELFLKLLEDPNSLLVKHIQELRDSQAGKEPVKSLSEDRQSESGLHTAKQQEGAEPAQMSQKKNGHNLFWKKIKWDRYTSKGSSNHQPSDTLKISEPCLARTQTYENRTTLSPSHHYSLRNSWQNGKNRPEHAVMENIKEQHSIKMDETSHKLPYYDLQGSEFAGKWMSEKVVGRSSRSSAKLDSGNTAKSLIDAKGRKKIGKPKDFELGNNPQYGSTSGSSSKSSKISAVNYSKQNESSIYAEAKRHLSEMLSDEGKDQFFSTNQPLGPLGTILSLPGYNVSSKLSPQWETEHGFVTAEMRYSPCGNFPTGAHYRRSLQKETNRTSQQNPDDPPYGNVQKSNDWLQVSYLPSDAKLHESILTVRDDSCHEGVVNSSRTHEKIHLGESNRLEPDSRLETRSKQSNNATYPCQKNEHLELSGLDVPLEDQSRIFPFGVSPASPSSSIQGTEDSEGIKDRADQTSPVSVLEPFPMEDVSSPSSIIHKRSDEPPTRRLEPTFSQHCSTTRTLPSDPAVDFSSCVEDHEFAEKYAREVIEAYGLNGDELSADYCDDQKLLFDCINEVVLEAHDRYFRHLPWTSFMKPKIQPVPLTERDMVHEIMDGVDRRLLLQLSSEGHIKRDVEKSGEWLDLRTEVEGIAHDLVEASVEALIEEIILEQRA